MEDVKAKFTELAQKRLYAVMQEEVKRGSISSQAASYIHNLTDILQAMPVATNAKAHSNKATIGGHTPKTNTGGVYDDLQEELEGAQKYLDRYKTGKDGDYLRMAREEVTHAKKFLTQLQRENPSSQQFTDAFNCYNKLEKELANQP